MTKLRVLDLFSGIGGLSLGLERSGKFQTTAFCEPDPYASKVLSKWWPDVPNFTHGIVGLNSLLSRVRIASRQAFPARISHSLAQAPDLPGLARDSFGHSCEPFAWYDPESRSWRTWQRCLVEGWEIFSGTWPRSGMTRSGIAYRRPPLVPLTDATASGSLLPTPEASNTKAIAMRSGGRSPRNFMMPIPTPRPCSGLRSSGANRTEIMRALEDWPTPTASLGTKGGRITPRKGREGGTLIEAVSARSFATPTARDWRSGKASEATHDKNSRPLSEQVGGSLNPTWVEWLMGFPLGWTDLGASATASCPNASNSSNAPLSQEAPMPGDQFTSLGLTWHRDWIGGRYEWTADNGRLKAFRDGRGYRFSIDDNLHPDRQISLRSAMDRAAIAAQGAVA